MAQQDEKKQENQESDAINRISSGVTYHLVPLKGLSTDNKYLSCTQDGKKVDLYKKDDNSGRQQWLITKVGMEQGNGVYHLNPNDGIFGTDNKYLSCTPDGKKVDLYPKDDDSGRQRWVFLLIGEDPETRQPMFNIRVEKGTTDDRTLLSCTDNGEVVDLYTKDDESGRQKWVVTPLDLEIVSIDYQVDSGKILGENPTVIATQTLENNTDQEQSMKFTVKESVVNQSQYNNTFGISVTVGTEFEASVPFVSKGKISVSATTSYEHSWGGSTTTSQEWSQEFPVSVKAQTTVRAEAVVTKAKMDVPYVATLKSKKTGQTAIATGVWSGTSTYNITYKIENV